MTITEIIFGIIVALISGIGGAIAAVAALRRIPSQNSENSANAVSLYEQAAARRQQENDQLRIQIKDITDRLKRVEDARSGPFRIILEFTTSPELKIIRAEMEVISSDDTLVDVVGRD